MFKITFPYWTDTLIVFTLIFMCVCLIEKTISIIEYFFNRRHQGIVKIEPKDGWRQFKPVIFSFSKWKH